MRFALRLRDGRVSATADEVHVQPPVKATDRRKRA
jgi:hypothetical protein